MRYFLSHIFLFFFFGIYAQIDTLPSYFIENEQVVLEFDIRKYEEGEAESFSKIFQFAGINIASILNKQHTWPQDGWDLKNPEKHIYQLRKNLNEFDKELNWLAKYDIDGYGWTEPISEIRLPLDSLSIQNFEDLKPKNAKVSEDGNVTFNLPGFKDAEQVILSGSFNQWHEQEIKMSRKNDAWTISLELQNGIYEYKFIVDGKWMHDPANSLKVSNEHKTWNSILLVGETITFHLDGYTDAKKVILSGSFNNWNEEVLKMKKEAEGWTIDLPLPPGKHYYKFIVDKNWILDSENIFQEPDQSGNWNSVLIIH